MAYQLPQEKALPPLTLQWLDSMTGRILRPRPSPHRSLTSSSIKGAPKAKSQIPTTNQKGATTEWRVDADITTPPTTVAEPHNQRGQRKRVHLSGQTINLITGDAHLVAKRHRREWLDEVEYLRFEAEVDQIELEARRHGQDHSNIPFPTGYETKDDSDDEWVRSSTTTKVTTEHEANDDEEQQLNKSLALAARNKIDSMLACPRYADQSLLRRRGAGRVGSVGEKLRLALAEEPFVIRLQVRKQVDGKTVLHPLTLDLDNLTIE
ncbi:hypothetical protein B0T21DRAFT_415256 [Apiosordaria backusii]|uniref:Uncharacterized protein n=1 Tax=Apiosordaria backusii TaxID=314023 RepID=A0AA40AIL9_9PEZI|nr:hypothetical protein B0T21DRAFT_415256 [Apiosordaria backusii]